MRIYDTGQVFIDADGNKVHLTAAESSVVSALSTPNSPASYHEKIAVIALLKQYGNAEKVLEVLILENKVVHASYTLAPIITQIGERTPQEYVDEVNLAVARFNNANQEYRRRFQLAKTEKERSAAVAWWHDYLWRIK